jgi:hypothetical protein
VRLGAVSNDSLASFGFSEHKRLAMRLTLALMDCRCVNPNGRGFLESNVIISVQGFGAEPVVEIGEDRVAEDFVVLGKKCSRCI